MLHHDVNAMLNISLLMANVFHNVHQIQRSLMELIQLVKIEPLVLRQRKRILFRIADVMKIILCGREPVNQSVVVVNTVMQGGNVLSVRELFQIQVLVWNHRHRIAATIDKFY